MPMGRAMFQMCGVFAELERSMIQERVRAPNWPAENKARVEAKIRELAATG